MNSRHLVASDLLDALGQMPSFKLTLAELPAIRSAILASLKNVPPSNDGVTMSTRLVPGYRGSPDVTVFIYRPVDAAGPWPVLLHIHGGGHIVGAPTISDARNRSLVRGARCVVVSPQYRLSPENPFPAALHDTYAALRWIQHNAVELELDPARIAIGGESAGGGLAAALAQLARDEAEIPIVLQLLTYPMLDNRTGRTIDRGTHCGEFVWTAESNRFGWDALLGKDHPVDDPRPYAVPARCENLAGLPPAFIAVGTVDLFAEEDIEYARRLIQAGVPTELHVYPGGYHGFDIVPGAWSAESFKAHQVAALRRALHPADSRALLPLA